MPEPCQAFEGRNLRGSATSMCPSTPKTSTWMSSFFPTVRKLSPGFLLTSLNFTVIPGGSMSWDIPPRLSYRRVAHRWSSLPYRWGEKSLAYHLRFRRSRRSLRHYPGWTGSRRHVRPAAEVSKHAGHHVHWWYAITDAVFRCRIGRAFLNCAAPVRITANSSTNIPLNIRKEQASYGGWSPIIRT